MATAPRRKVRSKIKAALFALASVVGIILFAEFRPSGVSFPAYYSLVVSYGTGKALDEDDDARYSMDDVMRMAMWNN